ncbi:uncharacterized protein EAF01_009140 [Botrytis porri]|uniref:uncharacterized protein n=1 Tax=Botrytis porri TaxID=87229 RepID=UPI001901A553|nr:uncharacterized protein EAF01_009140 [Botrytis porri]KAF7896737.1 hypothetical protein EAF01_009140 [Botrytis porri]
MSSSDKPVPNGSIMTESSPTSSDFKHEIHELLVQPDTPEFPLQLDEKTVPEVRVRNLQRMKELDNFIVSALAQFPVDDFIKRFTMAEGKLQRFYTYKTQIDADQGKEINDNIETMKAEILESRKVLSLIMEQICAFPYLSQNFPELEMEELVASEKQYVIDQLQKAKKKLEALDLMCFRLHTMIDQCSRILGGRWDKY